MTASVRPITAMLDGKGEPAVAVALARGATAPEAAEAGGITDRTVRRRMADTHYRRSVEQLRAEVIAEAVGRLADAAATAVATLLDVAQDGASEHARVAASNGILAALRGLWSDLSVERRLAELEAVVHRQGPS